MSPNQNAGLKWEMYVSRQLKARGYTVKMSNRFTSKCVDMRANGLPIEVKYANPTMRRQGGKSYNRWQWHIADTQSLHRGTDWALVLIAAAEGRLYHYILPGGMGWGRSQVQITSHPANYSGWLTDWFEQWEVIHYLSNKLYDGGRTYHDWALTTPPHAIDYSRELDSQRLEKWACNG